MRVESEKVRMRMRTSSETRAPWHTGTGRRHDTSYEARSRIHARDSVKH